MRAISRRFFDCGLDELEDFLRLVRFSGESDTVSGDRVKSSNLPVKTFNRASQTLGQVVKTFNRASQTLGWVVKSFNRVSTNSNRVANLFNRPVKSFGGLAQTSNRAPYNFNAWV